MDGLPVTWTARVQHPGARPAPRSSWRGRIEATFATLGERLAGNEPGNLAAQLPQDLGDPLGTTGGQEDFALAEFYRRVAEKEGGDEELAIQHARAVALVLQEAVTTGEMDDVRGQLKDEYAELFGRPGE